MNTEFARRQMVEQQVRTWDVTDPEVLAVLAGTVREHFVPDDYTAVAYADTEIPIGHGQVMLRPSIEGRLLQALQIRPGDRVLEIGTGTGYLTACLAALSAHVTSVEIHEDFIARARHQLDDAEIGNVEIVAMDAIAGLPDGTFDVIAVTGSSPEPIAHFAEALNAGGRLFTVIGRSPVKHAWLTTKTIDGQLATKALFETDIPPLVNAERPPAFSF